MARVASIAVVWGLMVVVAGGVGCESTPEEPFKGQDVFWSYPSYVPANAVTLAEGPGRLEARTPHAGTAYLLDLDQQVTLREEEGEEGKNVNVPKVVITGLVPAGRTLVFDPAAGTIGAKDGGRAPIKLRNIDPKHRYQIRLAPQEK